MADIPQSLYEAIEIENRLVMLYLTCSEVIQSGLKRGFRYFKVSPIKAFQDICHVSVDKVLQLAGKD